MEIQSLFFKVTEQQMQTIKQKHANSYWPRDAMYREYGIRVDHAWKNVYHCNFPSKESMLMFILQSGCEIVS